LDAELVTQISGFVTSHVGLNTNLASVEKENRAGRESGSGESAKKKQKLSAAVEKGRR
jgi:hypothetical protein